MDKIIENKTCKKCSQNFPIYKEDRDFYEKISPVFGGEKFQIPDPTLCPACREQRRLGIWNERNLYKRTCNATGKGIISMYHPESEYIVYHQNFWWGDTWEVPLDGVAFDYTKDFFSQFSDLLKKVPKRALVKGTGSINCDYTNCLGASKNCYLVFNGTNCEDSLYVDGMSDVDGCIDCSWIKSSQRCYECIDVVNCNDCQYSQDCENCDSCSHMLNCINCTKCFGCVNLQNKSYCIFNTQYSKDEYKREIKKIKEGGYSQEDFREYVSHFPQKALKIVGSENVSGDRIYNSKNIHKSFEVHDAENIRYATNVYRGAHDCMDGNVCLNESSRLYEMSLANKRCLNLLFCHDCWNTCHNLIYCTECKLTKDCFGCTGLVGQQYCILNKQYSKQEYEVEVKKIITHMKKSGEWGEFFPLTISPFGYNESAAYREYPIRKEEVEDIGGKWTDYVSPSPIVNKIVSAQKLPSQIEDIPDDILNWAIRCEASGKAFRIIGSELQFYRKYKLSIPKCHPDQRYADRLSRRNPRKLFERKCHKCDRDVISSYSPKMEIIVYCETCFDKEIYE